MKINFNDPMSLLYPNQRKREKNVLIMESNEDIYIVSQNKRYGYSLTKPLSESTLNGAKIIITPKDFRNIKNVPVYSINRVLVRFRPNLQSKSVLIQRHQF